jgi:hypothetical protein
MHGQLADLPSPTNETCWAVASSARACVGHDRRPRDQTERQSAQSLILYNTKMAARWFRSRGDKADRVQVKLPSALDAEAGSPIDLPDIDDERALEIRQANLQATQALYFSAMLEKTRLSKVTDKLVELFNAGVLPFGRRKKRGDDR